MTILGHMLQNQGKPTWVWEVLHHPPYSPDIAPSDYNLLLSMALGLSEQHFHSYEDAKKWVNSRIASKDLSFCELEFKCCQKDGEK
ncbi:hypothetical protein AVEN_114879-1 [Araneus ventricosus]|uniref:Mariner Mos1 transposase n=1 Tax=Araneus ventricosus TaxID=182803 RepID=A0A4Y2M095_ARAVE|nr:hypothetical protein AVEN_114879-1 [Araneus ventricosus]